MDMALLMAMGTSRGNYLLYYHLEPLVSPAGPQLFVTLLGAIAVTLCIANEIQQRRLRKKLENGEPHSLLEKQALDTAQQTIEELQNKLSAFEDTQPHLTTTVIP